MRDRQKERPSERPLDEFATRIHDRFSYAYPLCKFLCGTAALHTWDNAETAVNASYYAIFFFFPVKPPYLGNRIYQSMSSSSWAKVE